MKFFIESKLFKFSKRPILLLIRGLVDYYKILDISEDSNEEVIKKAFREKAKKMHPDIIKLDLKRRNCYNEQTAAEAHQRFVQLRTAYETLANRDKRKQYLEDMQSFRRSSFRNDHGGNHTSSNPPFYDTSDFEKEFVKSSSRFKRKNRASNSLAVTNVVTFSWEEFEKDWNQAMNTAIHGPQICITRENPFPENLETEELRSTKFISSLNRIIMFIVSGRTELGKIIYPEEERSNSSVHGFFKPIRSNDKEVGIGIEMNDLRKINEEEDVLELHWQGSLRTLGRRIIADGLTKIEFYINEEDETKKSKENDQSTFHGMSLTGFIEQETDPNSGAKAAVYIDQKTKIMTHFIRSPYFPGVQSLHIYNTIGKYLEYKCTRAWLPSSSFWVLPPRVESFDSGGWYIERNKDGVYSSRYKSPESASFRSRPVHGNLDNSAEYSLSNPTKSSIDPSIAILICAFSSLDRMRKS